MTSTTFFKLFLRNEKDQDILNSQYVLDSLKIRSGGTFKNVISATNTLFPSPEVLMFDIKDSSFKEYYYEQLEDNKAFLATIILGSLKEKFNIIFLCSKKEGKLKYHELISDYIYNNFGYPMYDYKDYVLNKYELLDYDPKEVEKLCKKCLKETEKSSYLNKIRDDYEEEIKDLKKKPKVMKKILKDHGYYWKGMSKDDMIEMLEMVGYDD
jgi:hypothetical protein